MLHGTAKTIFFFLSKSEWHKNNNVGEWSITVNFLCLPRVLEMSWQGRGQCFLHSITLWSKLSDRASVQHPWPTSVMHPCVPGTVSAHREESTLKKRGLLWTSPGTWSVSIVQNPTSRVNNGNRRTLAQGHTASSKPSLPWCGQGRASLGLPQATRGGYLNGVELEVPSEELADFRWVRN